LKAGAFKRWLGAYPEPDLAIQKMMRKGRLTAGLRWYRANFSKILFQSWPKCKVPTLSIWSDQDPFLTEKQVLDSRHYMAAEWDYFRMENTGHWIPLQQPKALSVKAVSWFSLYES
jgi:pimeloyl-ACP methyl ester carboxylesterase